MAADDLARWIPASIGAAVSVVLVLRVFIRYDRLFVDDAVREVRELRRRVEAAEAETVECQKDRVVDRQTIATLTYELEVLKRQVAALSKENP